MGDEEESKRLRIYHREKRLELQLIIERCNEVDFEYVCIPNVRNERDYCFGTFNPRKISLISEKGVDSFMRRTLMEHHEESKFDQDPEPKRQTTGHEEKEIIEEKLSFPFSSKVPRFPPDIIDSTGVYRQRKRGKKTDESKPKMLSAFGSSISRNCVITRDKLNTENPGPGVYYPYKPEKDFYKSDFGGKRVIEKAYEIVCSAKTKDTKCDLCEEDLRNVYWKNIKDKSILCRSCYKTQYSEIQRKTRIVDKFRKLFSVSQNYKKYRSCEFYHDHQNSTAAIRLLSPKTLRRRIILENLLSTKFMY